MHHSGDLLRFIQMKFLIKISIVKNKNKFLKEFMFLKNFEFIKLFTKITSKRYMYF